MKAVVLLSGGVDSSTCLGLAVRSLGAENVTALSIIYGQKHIKEIKSADAVAAFYKVPLKRIDISNIMQFSDCSLLKGRDTVIPHKSYAEQQEETHGEPVSTYVPFRNGLMLSTAASIALSIYPHENISIIYGAHADDAAGNAYPDCSATFVFAMNAALSEGSGHHIHLVAPFYEDTKAEVVRRGLSIGVPYELTWSCYEGGEKACGTCGTCIDRKAAFKANGVEDPIEYAE